MRDEFDKYKDLIKMPEHKSVPFDLHKLSVTKHIREGESYERLTYMKAYESIGVIMDFYKTNSNIIIMKNDE